MEKSAGGSVFSESRRMVGDLEYVWKMFIQGSQEQLTRLRVAGVFFRTMEQVNNEWWLLFVWFCGSCMLFLTRLEGIHNKGKMKMK